MQTDQAGSSHRLYEGLNSHKTSFASIYDAPTPTAYFTAMRDAEYQIPQNAKLTTLVILRAAKRAKSRRSIRVLDVGCSYGVNAALLKHDISRRSLRALFIASLRRADPVPAHLQRPSLLLEPEEVARPRMHRFRRGRRSRPLRSGLRAAGFRLARELRG